MLTNYMRAWRKYAKQEIAEQLAGDITNIWILDWFELLPRSEYDPYQEYANWQWWQNGRKCPNDFFACYYATMFELHDAQNAAERNPNSWPLQTEAIDASSRMRDMNAFKFNAIQLLNVTAGNGGYFDARNHALTAAYRSLDKDWRTEVWAEPGIVQKRYLDFLAYEDDQAGLENWQLGKANSSLN